MLASKAKQSTVEALCSAEHIGLHKLEHGSFARAMAEVHVDGQSLGGRLMAAGLAIPFVEGQGGKAWTAGKTPPPWQG